MPKSYVVNARLRQFICILGMAMVWPSIHNQLLYPLTFSFHNEDSISPYPFYLIYSFVLLVVVLILVIADRERIVKRLFSSKIAVGVFAVLGTLGIVTLVFCNPSANSVSLLMGAGVSLSGMFVPIFFIFWSLQLVYISKKRAAFDLILSYMLFSLITLIRIALGLHAWIFAICYPLISGACAIFILMTQSQETKGRYALGKSSVRGLPLFFLIPSVLLVYVGTVIRCIMIPDEATYDYPSTIRVVVYISLLILMFVLAVFYRPKGSIRRFADTISLILVALFLVAGILTVGFAGDALSNFPAIAGINAVEVFIWILVLMNSQIRHSGIIGPAAAYLIGVIGVTHLVCVLVVGGSEFAQFDSVQLPVLLITVVIAFVIVVIVNVIMIFMLYRSQQQQPRSLDESEQVGGVSSAQYSEDAIDAASVMSSGLPDSWSQFYGEQPMQAVAGSGASVAAPHVKKVSDEEVYQNIQEMFGLSKRETETLRLAVRNKSAKEIADTLFVAESTVNSHIKGIYRKCDVHSRKDLIALVNHFKNEQK